MAMTHQLAISHGITRWFHPHSYVPPLFIMWPPLPAGNRSWRCSECRPRGPWRERIWCATARPCTLDGKNPHFTTKLDPQDFSKKDGKNPHFTAKNGGFQKDVPKKNIGVAKEKMEDLTKRGYDFLKKCDLIDV